MTKITLAQLFKRFDEEKYSTFQHGSDFEIVIHDQAHDTFLHTGIGSGESMSKMCLFSLVSLYEMAADHERTSIEEFAESMRKLLINAYKDDIFGLKRIDEE